MWWPRRRRRRRKYLPWQSTFTMYITGLPHTHTLPLSPHRPAPWFECYAVVLDARTHTSLMGKMIAIGSATKGSLLVGCPGIVSQCVIVHLFLSRD